MKQSKFEDLNFRRMGYGAVLVTTVLIFGTWAGCDQPLAPNETYHKLVSAPPIFSLERSEGVDENGIRWKKVKGDACCWLASWEKEERFDESNFRIYRKERDTFFPLYNTEIEESEEFRHKWGSVLWIPYRSKRMKTVEPAP